MAIYTREAAKAQTTALMDDGEHWRDIAGQQGMGESSYQASDLGRSMIASHWISGKLPGQVAIRHLKSDAERVT